MEFEFRAQDLGLDSSLAHSSVAQIDEILRKLSHLSVLEKSKLSKNIIFLICESREHRTRIAQIQMSTCRVRFFSSYLAASYFNF
jgi:hypothetical protein